MYNVLDLLVWHFIEYISWNPVPGTGQLQHNWLANQYDWWFKCFFLDTPSTALEVTLILLCLSTHKWQRLVTVVAGDLWMDDNPLRGSCFTQELLGLHQSNKSPWTGYVLNLYLLVLLEFCIHNVHVVIYHYFISLHVWVSHTCTCCKYIFHVSIFWYII